jgi:hypothetical protein
VLSRNSSGLNNKIDQMNLKQLISPIIGAALLMSCGGSSKGPEMKVEAGKSIEGPLAGYIEVVDQPYLIEFEKGGGIEGNDLQAYVNVKFKMIKPLDFELPVDETYNVVDLTLASHDEAGTSPVSESFGLAGLEHEAFVNFLKSGSGEKVFKMRGPQMISSADDFFEKADWMKVKSFNILSAIKGPKVAQAETTTTESGSDCEAFLREYEAFMTEYVSVAREYALNRDDQDLLADYTNLLGQASSWATKTMSCAADPAFASKFAAIQMKIAQAAL